MTDTTDRMQRILVDHLGVDAEQVKPEAHLADDLQADSLDIVELVMAFEEEWSIEIPDDDGEKLATVGDCVELVDRKVAEKAAA